MYTLNGWWFLSSGGAYPPVFTVDLLVIEIGWIVLEIQEGGTPPNLADSLGIESIYI